MNELNKQIWNAVRVPLLLFAAFVLSERGAVAASVVQIADATLEVGSAGEAPVQLLAEGGENGIGFSVVFDPSVVEISDVVLGADAGNASLLKNMNQSAEGRVGIALLLPAGDSFNQGTFEIVKLLVNPISGSAATETFVGFGDEPVRRQVGDADANELNSEFNGRTLVIDRLLSLSAIGDQTLQEDGVLNAPLEVQGRASVLDQLSLSGQSDNPSLVPNGNILFSGTGAERLMTITPLPNQFGSANITVSLSDGTETVNQTFQLSVIPVNDPPTLNAISNRTILEDDFSFEAALNGIGSGAANENQTLSLSVSVNNTALIPGFTIQYSSPSPTGTIEFRVAPDRSGDADVTVTVHDGGAENASFSRTFTVSVAEVNDPPILDPIANRSGVEGNVIAFQATARDVDIPPSALRFSLGAGAPSGASIDANTGQFRFTPTEAQGPGSYSVTVVVTDRGTPAQSASRSFLIDVTERNESPVLGPIESQVVREDETLVVGLRASDSDLPANILQYRLEAGPAGATVEPNTGEFRWTPTEEQSPGFATATVSVRDDGNPAGSDQTSFEIEVIAVNDPPEIALPLDPFTVDEDGELAVAGVRINDPDVGEENLQVLLSAQNGVLRLAGEASDSARTRIAFEAGLQEINRLLGEVVYRPNPEFNGEDLLTVTATDLGHTGEGGERLVSSSIAINVPAVNDPPFISPFEPERITIHAGETLAPIPFSLGDHETPSDGLTLELSTDNPELLPLENILIRGQGSDRALELNPAPGRFGEAAVAVTVHDGDGGSDSASLTLVVLALPPSDANVLPRKHEVLAGANVEFRLEVQGTPPFEIQWFRFDEVSNSAALIPGATGPTLALTNVQTTHAGLYFAEAVNVTGDKAVSLRSRLIVKERLVIVREPDSVSINQGSLARFDFMVSGTGPIAYQWYRNNQPIAGANGPVLEILNARPSDEGEFFVVAKNNVNQVQSRTVFLEVGIPARIIRDLPGSLTVVAGEKVLLSVGVVGSKPISVEWFKNGSSIGTGANLDLGKATPSHAGNYQAVASNRFNGPSGALSNTLNLQVIEPPFITGHPLSQSAINGEEAIFSVSVTGTLPLRFQWQRNGVNIPGANQQTLRIPSVNPSMDGAVFQVVVNNASQVASTSDRAVLTVLRRVEIVRQPTDKRVSAGNPFQLQVKAQGTAPLSYQWLKDGQPLAGGARISGVNSPVLSVAAAEVQDAGAYQARVSNAAGSVDSAAAAVEIIVKPALVVTPGSDTLAALGSQMTWSVEAQGATPPFIFQWQKNGVSIDGANQADYTIDSFELEDGGAYTVAVKASDGAAITSDPVTLIPDIPTINLADNFDDRPVRTESAGMFRAGSNAGATLETSESVNANFLSNSLWFSIRPSTGGLMEVNTVGSAFDGFVIVSTGDTINAQQLIARDNDDGGFFTSRAVFDVQQDVTYNVAVYSVKGSTGHVAVSWNIEPSAQPLPVINTQPSNFTVQEGGVGLFAVGVAPIAGAQLTFQWYFEDVAIPQARSQSLLLTDVASEDAGRYYVRVAAIDPGADPNAPFPLASTHVRSRGVQLIVTALPPITEVVLVSKFSDLFSQFGPGPFSNPGGNSNAIQLQGGLFENAIDLSGFGTGGFTSSQIFSTTGTFKEPGEPNHCDVIGGASQWSFLVPIDSGVIRLSTEGSSFDTVLAVYRAANIPVGGFDELISVACDNDGGANLTSIVSFDAVANETYYIVVDGVNGASGQVRLTSQLEQPPAIISGPGDNLITGQSLFGVGLNQAPQGPVKTVSEGETVTFVAQAENPLNGGSEGIVYQWQYSATGLEEDFFNIGGESEEPEFILDSVARDDEGYYRVVASNFAGESASEAVRLVVNVAVTIIEQPEDAINVPPGSDVTISVAVSGSDPIEFRWFFQSATSGQEVFLAENTGSSLELQDVAEQDAGTYRVEADNPVTPQPATASTLLTLNDFVAIGQHPASQTVNAGASVSFVVAAAGGDSLSYQWLFKGAEIAGATSDVLILNNVSASNAGNYSVLVSNEFQTVESDDALLTVATPLRILQAPSDQEASVGSTISLSVVAEGSGTLAYQWLKDGQPLAQATESILILEDVQLADGGVYQVTVDNGAESVSAQANVEVQEQEPWRLIIESNAQDPQQVILTVIGPAGNTFIIERSSVVSAGAVWAPVSGTELTLEGDTAFVDLPVENGAAFYRIRQTASIQ